MFVLAPSILAADFGNLEKDIKTVADAGAQYIHIDVMDGIFVPSISFGMPVIKSVRKYTNAFFDAHLMIEKPERYVADFAECGADGITVHAEACEHLDRNINQIKELGLKAGVALNPATSLSVLDYVLDSIDMVLIMSVNPGFGGQKYIPYSTRKISELREMIEDRNLDVDIQVDGGISLSNLREVLDAGANNIVAGSAVYAGNTEENVKAFLNVMKDYKK